MGEVLFDPLRHEALSSAASWDEDAAREGIAWIAAQIEASFDAEHLWPAHPRDEETLGLTGHPRSLFLGAGGTLLGLGMLHAAGRIELRRHYRSTLLALEAMHDAQPDVGHHAPGLLVGSAGLALLAWLAAPEPSTAERLVAGAEASAASAAQDLFHGAAGGLHVLRLLDEHGAGADAAGAWRRAAEQLMAAWQPDARLGCRVWRQSLGELEAVLTGAAHGLAGNLHALLRGARLLEPEARRALEDDAAQAIVATARRGAGGRLANWPPAFEVASGPGSAGPFDPIDAADAALGRVSWSNGAPGVLLAARGLGADAHPELEATLEAAARLIVEAGPVRGEPSLAHGTAGQALALLAQHERTGEVRWLEAARATGAHALGQVRKLALDAGGVHAGLWTGDLGVALVLGQLLDGGPARLPALDGIERAALSGLP